MFQAIGEYNRDSDDIGHSPRRGDGMLKMILKGEQSHILTLDHRAKGCSAALQPAPQGKLALLDKNRRFYFDENGLFPVEEENVAAAAILEDGRFKARGERDGAFRWDGLEAELRMKQSPGQQRAKQTAPREEPKTPKVEEPEKAEPEQSVADSEPEPAPLPEMTWQPQQEPQTQETEQQECQGQEEDAPIEENTAPVAEEPPPVESPWIEDSPSEQEEPQSYTPLMRECPMTPIVTNVSPFPDEFPESQWRKIEYKGMNSHYLLGDIFSKGTLVATAFAVPAAYSPVMPPWVDKRSRYYMARNGAGGYWVLLTAR